MARRSNKTAHVLNLLAGHDGQNDSPNDSQNDSQDAAPETSKDMSGSDTSASAADGTGTASQAASAKKEPEKPVPVVAQNISVIDKTEKDPIADLIQQKLLDEFEKSQQDSHTQDTAVTEAEDTSRDEDISSPAEIISTTGTDETAVKMETETETDTTAEEEAEAEPLPEVSAKAPTDTDAEAADDTIIKVITETPADTSDDAATATASSDTSDDAAATASSDTFDDAAATASSDASDETASTASSDTSDETVTASSEPVPVVIQAPQAEPEQAVEPIQEPEPEPEAEPEPEPEFAYLNVMERIVEDKIIYFMRQFDVCTCDRCKADTIALTMNGLMPKYIVTTPAAIDPLLSYYTNRLISDVTVEATKACMVVKENPRH